MLASKILIPRPAPSHLPHLFIAPHCICSLNKPISSTKLGHVYLLLIFVLPSFLCHLTLKDILQSYYFFCLLALLAIEIGMWNPRTIIVDLSIFLSAIFATYRLKLFFQVHRFQIVILSCWNDPFIIMNYLILRYTLILIVASGFFFLLVILCILYSSILNFRLFSVLINLWLL